MSQTQSGVTHQVRLDLLREALPYIQRFKGKTFVVKLSGKATEDAANLLRSARNWPSCNRSGYASALCTAAASS